MIYLLLLVSLAGDNDMTAVTQRRVDQVVQRCAAGKVLKLLAHGGNDILLHPLIVTRPPTPAENKRFGCVLNGLKQMPELHLGFIGNEVGTNGS